MTEKGPLFHPLITQAILDRTLTITDLRVLAAISQNPGENRNFIAEVAGINPRQVFRSAKQLAAAGLIKISQKRWVYNGEPHKENAYYLGEVFDAQPVLPSFEQANKGTLESSCQIDDNINKGTPESSPDHPKINKGTQESYYKDSEDGHISDEQQEDSGVLLLSDENLNKGTQESPSCMMMHDESIFKSDEEKQIYEKLDFLQGSNRLKAARSKRVSLELASAWHNWILAREYGSIDNPPGFAFSEMRKGVYPPSGQVQLPGDIVETESIPVVDWPTEPQNAVPPEEALWSETQSMLQRQMTRATYDAIVQGTRLMAHENGVYTIGVQTDMAKEWLENRLRDVIQRALASVIGVNEIEVEFVLFDEKSVEV